LITGAFAERAKFGPFLLFMALRSLLVYAPVAHWVFASDGWIAANVKGVDFAGGTAIHLNAGAAARAAAGMLGRRKGCKEEPMEAIGIGAVAGILCFLAVQWRTRTSLDDSLDVVAVHGVGGLWGALATGIFCVAALTTGTNAAGFGVDGLTNGGGIDQLWRQA